MGCFFLNSPFNLFGSCEHSFPHHFIIMKHNSSSYKKYSTCVSQDFRSSASAGPPPVDRMWRILIASFFFVRLLKSCHFFFTSATSLLHFESLTAFTLNNKINTFDKTYTFLPACYHLDLFPCLFLFMLYFISMCSEYP